MPGKPCVLVVDDESAVRLFVSCTLEREGYDVLGAGDGVEALELLERRGYGIDLVLTDIRMPRLDGLELGRRVAKLPGPIPIAYMSADPPRDVVCLEKPFSMAALVALVEGLTARPRYARPRPASTDNLSSAA
jgi:CheY-like chemotaxis protein